MAVSIVFRLSGGASNSDPNASTGGVMSSAVVGTGLNGLWDAVSSGEASSGDTEYRCIFVTNTGTTTAVGAKIWIQSNTADSEIAIALDGNGKNADAETEANEATAPSGETFSQPTSAANGLSLGDLAQNDRFAVWMRRAIGALTPASGGKSYTLRVGHS